MAVVILKYLFVIVLILFLLALIWSILDTAARADEIIDDDKDN